MAANQAPNAVALAAAQRGQNAPKNATGKSDTAWVDVQARTFTNWVNVQLEQVGSKVDKVEEDFKNGVKLLQTLEICSKKSVGKYSKTPKMKANELENCTMAFNFLKAEGLTLVNIGPADVNDGNLKLLLGLIWTIIYHYQVSAGFKEAGPANAKKTNAKDLLLEWVRSKIPEYNIQNFTSDWQDGRAVCALTNAVGGQPELLPNHRQMVPGAATRNCALGIDTAKDHLGVPKLISAEDLSTCPDEHSVMTYVSYFKTAQRLDSGPKLAPHLDNEDGRKAMACQHSGCKKVRDNHPKYCPDHACLHKSVCENLANPGTQACPKHACKFSGGACKDPVEGECKACPSHKCRHQGCGEPKTSTSPYCASHACQHPSGCDKEAQPGKTLCQPHTCIYSNCTNPSADGDKWCPTHKPGAKAPVKALPPPWERDANNWRKYEGHNLGGRCKIRVYFSTTTSSQEIRKNSQSLMQLLEREKVHERPDFEPWIPVDVDMPKELRDKIFEKAGTRKTPMLFIDDEYVGDYEKVMQLNESGKLQELLKY